MNRENQSGFTLLEVLIAWSLFVIVMTGVLMVGSRTLKRLAVTQTLLFQVAQIHNIRDILLSVSSRQEADTLVQQWREHNRQLLPDYKDRLICSEQRCCGYIFKGLNKVSSCVNVLWK